MSNEAAVLNLADDVIARWAGKVSTHYEGCWRAHVACFAALVVDTLDQGTDHTNGSGDA